MEIFLIGMPLTCGGANQEAGDTAIFWKRYGLDVTCLYFTGCACGQIPRSPEPSNPWVERFSKAGIPFVGVQPGRLHEVPGLSGSIIVSFCHQHTLHNWVEFSKIRCKLIWSPTMCFTTQKETKAFKHNPPSAVHFQSNYQLSQTAEEYTRWGCKTLKMIRGAFHPLPFRPLSRKTGEPFVVGRLARSHRTKWHPHLWNILEAVRSEGVDVRALCMGWDEELDAHCGTPPDWAECLPVDSITPVEFLSRCHAMVCPNWGVEENFPRVGLEAMSAGVPLLVDNAGGWKEMVQDGKTGMLCDSVQEYIVNLTCLARNEPLRNEIISHAHEQIGVISNSDAIYREWVGLFSDLLDK